MKFIPALLLILLAVSLTAQRVYDKKYVCLPCGRTCDDVQATGPGNCPSCGMELIDAATIKFKTITFTELCTKLHSAREVVLLDVRSPAEFKNEATDRDSSYGKFKKAININVTELARRLAELDKFKDKEIIVYCSHSHRSPQASYFLSTHGFKNVANVAGGVSVLSGDPAAGCLKDQYVKF